MRFVMALPVLLALVACTPPPSSGIVIDRSHHDAFVWMMYMYNTDGSISGMLPITEPESWYLEISDGERSGWWSVSKSDFVAHPNGSHWSR